jgi:hypothetical protein
LAIRAQVLRISIFNCAGASANKAMEMNMGTILLIVLVLLLVGAIPAWPYSASWGYGPSGLLGIVAVVVVLLLLTGRL